MAEYLQAPPRRKALGLLADALTSGQEALNTVNLPYVGGLGGLLFGQAPQYLQDVSYGMPLLRGGNVATGGLGTLTPDTRMLDVATLPFVGAGAAKAGQVGAKTLGKEVARQVETGTGLIGSNVLDPRQYATAYHGSPHIFDKFDISKVGTGEGAQAFGHGMYFAENPEIAKQYQKSLSQNALINKETGQTFSPYDLDSRVTIQSGLNQGLSNEEIAKKIESAANEYEKIGGIPKQVTAPKLRNEAEMVKRGIIGTTEGALYKVDIPDKSIPKMLDWFKPLSEQTDEVKKALSNLPHRSKDWTFKDTLETLNAASHTKDIPGMNPTGQEIYSMIGRGMMTGNKAEGQRYASDLLSKQGISGIKYLDSGSRDTGGTSNYVVFDPSEVKILEKGLLK